MDFNLQEDFDGHDGENEAARLKVQVRRV